MIRAAVIAAATVAICAAGCNKKIERWPAGGRCSGDYECQKKLQCYERICTSAADVEAAEERKAEAERQSAIEKEARLLERAGAEAPTGEAAPIAGAGAKVRVVEITAKKDAFAACKKTERLTGGGCKGPALIANHPSAYGETDTVGARWICETQRIREEVTAFALCEALPQQ